MKMFDFLWSLESHVHRDLAFLLASPSLLRNTEVVPAITSQEWMAWFLDAKDAIVEDAQKPQRLEQFVDTPRQYKLGLYAEDLFLYYLHHFSPYEVLAHDIQVFDGKRSIGAFDFIIRMPTGQIEHWEMAIKYFVQYTPSPEWSEFIGPGGRDSLQRKMNKMLNRQILLGDNPLAQEGLRKRGIPIPTRKRIISVGKLFAQYRSNFIPPHEGDPQQPTGVWCKQDVFWKYQQQHPQSRWVFRKHPRWIGPSLCAKKEESMNAEEAWEFVERQEKHVMFSELREVSQGWQEEQRWFVMPPKWKKEEE